MSAEELLSKTVTQLPPPAAGVSSGDAHRVEETARQLEETASDLASMAGDLGITGDSADLGAERFLEVTRDLRRRADQCTEAAAVARRAYRALIDAKIAYQALPSGEIGSAQRDYFMRGGMINVGGQALSGPAAVNYLDQQAARTREYQAQQILNRLNAYMTVATSELPDVEVPRGGWPPPPPPPDPSGGGSGVGSYAPGGGGSAGVGSVPSGSGAVLDQPTGSPGTGTGAGAHDPAGGSGVTGPGTIGGGTSTPGAGSADGSVGGTVPGASTGPGGIGTGAGAGTGIGGAGGVLAGGTAIGGAAVGATGLGRSGLGTGGAGGIGGAGGLNAAGAGGAGGTGGLAGGARGATGIGATTGASGTGTGTGAGAAAGSRGMTGMPMGGGAAGAGSTKSKRPGSHGYLVPDLDIDDEPATIDLGPGAKAGSRDQLPPTPLVPDEDPDDETW